MKGATARSDVRLIVDREGGECSERTARCWSVARPGLAPIEVYFTPPANRADVEALYRGATAEPFPVSGREATATEEAELRGLIAQVLPDDPAAQAEVFAIARADAEAALESFRLLAADAAAKAS